MAPVMIPTAKTVLYIRAPPVSKNDLSPVIQYTETAAAPKSQAAVVAPLNATQHPPRKRESLTNHPPSWCLQDRNPHTPGSFGKRFRPQESLFPESESNRNTDNMLCLPVLSSLVILYACVSYVNSSDLLRRVCHVAKRIQVS